MKLLSPSQALAAHKKSLIEHTERTRLAKENKDKLDLIPEGFIIEDNGIDSKVLEYLVLAEKLSESNGRCLDKSKIFNLIKELIGVEKA